MKTTGLRIAIFPMGSAIKLKKDNIKRNDGSIEYYKAVWALTHNANVDQVLIVQKSDWDKLTDEEKADLDPRGVIFDVYSELGLRTPNLSGNIPDDEWGKYTNVYDALKDLPQPDFGIGFLAQGYTIVNMPNFLYKKTDPTKKNSVLAMTGRYAAPIVYYLNMTKLPYFVIATDPRYCTRKLKRRDSANRPLEFISQYNDVCEFTAITEHDPHSPEIMTPIKITYSGIERLGLVGERAVAPDNERTIKFAISAMQSSYGENATKDFRFDELKKWVLDQPDSEDYHIYGRWTDYFTKDHQQFKGLIPHTEIDEAFINTRYTLVIPIRPDWVTGKYVEMIRVGCLPFFHPKYDTQFSTIPKDHFLRVKDPADMYNKIKYLDENPEARIKLVKELQVKFLLGVRQGDFFADILDTFLKKHDLPFSIAPGYTEELKRVVKKTVKLF